MDRTWLVFLGLILATFVLLRALRKSRSPGGGSGRTEARERAAEVRDELDRLLLQLQEVSRENLARLDHKLRTLNLLLQEAREILDEIRKTREEIRTAGHTPAPPRPAPPHAAPLPADAAAPGLPLHEKVYRLVDQGMDVAGICRETGMQKGEIELILGLRAVPPLRQGT